MTNLVRRNVIPILIGVGNASPGLTEVIKVAIEVKPVRVSGLHDNRRRVYKHVPGLHRTDVTWEYAPVVPVFSYVDDGDDKGFGLFIDKLVADEVRLHLLFIEPNAEGRVGRAWQCNDMIVEHFDSIPAGLDKTTDPKYRDFMSVGFSGKCVRGETVNELAAQMLEQVLNVKGADPIKRLPFPQ